MDLAIQGNTLHTKAPPTGLLAKTALKECYNNNSQFVSQGRRTKLYALKDVAFMMTAKAKHFWSIDECISFLLTWKPKEKNLTFFNSGIDSKYFYFNYNKPKPQEITTAEQGFN